MNRERTMMLWHGGMERCGYVFWRGPENLFFSFFQVAVVFVGTVCAALVVVLALVLLLLWLPLLLLLLLVLFVASTLVVDLSSLSLETVAVVVKVKSIGLVLAEAQQWCSKLVVVVVEYDDSNCSYYDSD